MPRYAKPPVLYVVACGCSPASQLPEMTRAARAQGWDVCVILTPDGIKFIDAALLAEQTGHPVRSQYKDPSAPDVLPPADAFAVAPASFNTINKWAQGISDTLALGLLNEAIGLSLPIVAVPWVNAALARHPSYRRSTALLRDSGVRLIVPPDHQPGEGQRLAAFPWQDLHAELAALLRAITDRPAP
jgi:phosphopantothenoylcysteine synthetase/decarboxylase